MSDLQKTTRQLADLMEEFRLGEAHVAGDDWAIGFRRKPKATAAPMAMAMPVGGEVEAEAVQEIAAGPAAPTGVPVSSPMTGIFYSASSPSAPPFAKEGDTVQAGQVVALIEAMKVFNEIVAPTSGIVSKVVAQNGAIVNPGEPLLYIG